jgi:hypothetical protein
MALLYRDATTIYEPAQLINFSVEVEFYELPRGHLLRAYAEDLEEDLEKIQKFEDKFDGLYDTTKEITNICDTVTQVCGTVSTISGGLSAVAVVLEAWGMGSFISEAKNPIQGTLSGICNNEIVSQINTFCNYATCEASWLDLALGDYVDSEGTIGGDVGEVTQTTPVIDFLNEYNDIITGPFCEAIATSFTGETEGTS